MVCLGDIRMNTLYKGDKDKDNNNNNNHDDDDVAAGGRDRGLKIQQFGLTGKIIRVMVLSEHEI